MISTIFYSHLDICLNKIQYNVYKNIIKTDTKQHIMKK